MSSKKIQIRILIKLNSEIRKAADLMLTVATGDVYYKPSTNKQLTKDLNIEDFEHFSFHKSGQVLLKINNDKHKPIRRGLPTKDLGCQKFLSDLILEPEKLPLQRKVSKSQDIVFDIKESSQQILIILSIVSGKLISKSYSNGETTIKPINVKGKKEVVGLKNIALGHESGNSDKLLQLLCLKTSGDPKSLNTLRRIKIHEDEGIGI